MRALLIATLLGLAPWAFAGSVSAEPASCEAGPRDALRDVGMALTAGSDRSVLQAALRNEARLRVCGRERESISMQLIAADAYGDTNAPAKRCEALRDAARRLSRIDSPDTTVVRRAARACTSR